MTQRGWKVILKIGDGEEPENFSALEGVRVSLNLATPTISADNLNSGAWRNLPGAMGLKSLSFSASGPLQDETTAALLRAYAFDGEAHNYQLVFDNGDIASGAFLISRYTRTESEEDLENVSFSLESAGEVEYVAA